jgi:plasmid stabilization system protein ParE
MVKWTSKSEEDLDDIREHIAKNFNVDLAIFTIDQLIEQTENILSQNPLAGTLLESSPLFSKIVIEGNSIFYCENPKDHHLYIVYVRARNTRFKLGRLTVEDI